MDFNFDNERPIYVQLVEQIRIKIISGQYKMNEKLPSVRDFATMAKANPNTVQRALLELEKEGIIYTESTSGKFVTNDEKVINDIKNNIINDKVLTLMNDMESLGIKKEDIIKFLNQMKGV